MQKLKIFARTFWNSLTKPSYYKDILDAKFSFSLKYLLVLLFLASLIQGAVFAVSLLVNLPRMPYLKYQIEIATRGFYPDELEITVKDQKISTNVKEPYAIDIPALPAGTHLVTIDTKGEVENFAEYKTELLVTDSLVVMPDDSGGYKVMPFGEWLKDVPDGTIFDKKTYTSLTESLLPYLQYLPSAVVILAVAAVSVFPLFGTLLALGWQMFVLLILALLIFVIAKLMKKNLAYGQVYRLSMHGITVAVVLSFLLRFFRFNLGFINTLVFIVFMIVVLSKLEVKNDQLSTVKTAGDKI